MATKEKHVEAANKFLKKRNLSRAISEYQKALKLDSDDIRLRLRLGDLLLRDKRPEDAVDVLVKVANIYEDRGFLLKAVSVYKRILQMQPDEAKNRLQLASAYERLGQTAEAVAELREAARLFGQTGERVPRLKTIQRILDHDPENLRGRLKLAEAFSNAGLVRDASRELRKVVRQLERAQVWEVFVPVAERLLYHDARDTDIAKRLARYYLDHDEPQTALPKIEMCYRGSPDDTEVLGMLAQAFSLLGQTHKAVAVLRRKARVYERNGLQEERDQALREILELTPEDSEVRRRVGVRGSERDDAASGEIQIDEVSDQEVDALLAEMHQQQADEEPDVGAHVLDIPRAARVEAEELEEEVDDDYDEDYEEEYEEEDDGEYEEDLQELQQELPEQDEAFVLADSAVELDESLATAEGAEESEESIITSVDDQTLEEAGFSEGEFDQTVIQDVATILSQFQTGDHTPAKFLRDEPAPPAPAAVDEEPEVEVEMEVEAEPDTGSGLPPGWDDAILADPLPEGEGDEGEDEYEVVEFEVELEEEDEEGFGDDLGPATEPEVEVPVELAAVADEPEGTEPELAADEAPEPEVVFAPPEQVSPAPAAPQEQAFAPPPPSEPEPEPAPPSPQPRPAPSPAPAPAAPQPEAPQAASEEAGDDFDAELAELDFYLENGLAEEAHDLWADLTGRFPSHPELDRRRFLIE